jgi:hypothetical protein
MKPLHLVLLIIGLLLAALAILYFVPEKPSEPPSIAVPEAPPVVPVPPEPEIRYPLPEPAASDADEAAARPLPELDKSDPFMKDLLARHYKEPSLRLFLVSQQFIRRLVLIIDALPRKEVPMKHLPLRSPAGRFQTAGEEGARVIGPENARRYTPYVQLAEAVPAQGLATAYLRIYPLLQEAYRELGHPQGYFHDRMIAVLDHLLATPEVDEPIPLVAHVTQYRYADSELEERSAGQKILLRMGRDNARRVKVVLQNFRDRLVAASTER